jgi:hypothetical protein
MPDWTLGCPLGSSGSLIGISRDYHGNWIRDELGMKGCFVQRHRGRGDVAVTEPPPFSARLAWACGTSISATSSPCRNMALRTRCELKWYGYDRMLGC